MEREHRLTNLSNRFVDSGAKPLKSKEQKMRMVGPGEVATAKQIKSLATRCAQNRPIAPPRAFLTAGALIHAEWSVFDTSWKAYGVVMGAMQPIGAFPRNWAPISVIGGAHASISPYGAV
jgi:hypothetical protein